ncbi:+-neomenthol dehydrogenase-like protein [Cinnamomum micranthum f. kanehirae]|uniref:+-neomenthol dehydrogenase-like protein n=1 Tax=Cinnamomum micranthum f. kanehirae TaxID=337451 RepID=A0A3S3PSD8_9MAGN|nr:+-neomenthol dehydrogenase-like protein [Cinnamomum micranthum f. kanehirae]
MESKDHALEASSSATRWWSKETVAVVTGANKGIGLALVKRLAEMGLTVVLTCRDLIKGIEAVDSLAASGLQVELCRLDVADLASIDAFVSWLINKFGGLDVLVNNAAVSFNDIGYNSVDHAETVIKTNFYGPKLLTEALLPLFRRAPSVSRILNISSRLGLLKNVSNTALRELLQDEEGLSEEIIEDVVGQFLNQVKSGTWAQQGWPNIWTDYSVSKLALNAYSAVLSKRQAGLGLSVNCYCPGFTKTSMTRGQGKYTAEEAAEIGAQLALMPIDKLPTGKFFIGSRPSLFSKL